MANTYSFSLQQVQIAKWNGDGTYGTPFIGESTKDLDVSEKMVSDQADGNAIITATAAQVISYELALGTAGFDDGALAILYGITASTSGGGTDFKVGNQVRMPYFGLIAQVFPDNGDVLHFFPRCKMMQGVKYKLEFGKIVIPAFTAMAINDPTLSYMWWKRTRPLGGAITFPLTV